MSNDLILKRRNEVLSLAYQEIVPMTRHIKCIRCGKFNTDKTQCEFCGAELYHNKRRQIAHQLSEKIKQQKESKSPSFFDTYSQHRFWVVRAFVAVLHSIWVGFVAIGTFIAWLITMIAA